MNTIHITQENYQQYAPYDIVAVDESFRKLYDRRRIVFRFETDSQPPVDVLFNCEKGATLEEALCNENWLKFESTIQRPELTRTFRYFIHNSIKDEYLERNNGEIKWSAQTLYETLFHKHRIKLTSKNYKDFSPRRIMAMASLSSSSIAMEYIDEYGEWFSVEGLTEEEYNSVFTNHSEFKFETDETFFHMGLGTGMWVDKSIVNEFRAEVGRVCDGYFDNRPYLLHPVWNEIVWNVLDKKE